MLMMAMMILVLRKVVRMLHCWKPTYELRKAHTYQCDIFTMNHHYFIIVAGPACTVTTTHTHTCSNVRLLVCAHATGPVEIEADVGGQSMQYLRLINTSRQVGA
jgi:hypothetical protein